MRLFLLALFAAFACTLSCGSHPPAAEQVGLSQEQVDYIHAMIAQLERTNPPPLPTVVEFEDMSDTQLLGYTELGGPGIRIAIREGLHYQVLVDVLVHEWAHAVVRFVPQQNSHGPMWGVAYASCYRALLKMRPREE